ncbi:hypothetical protein V493_04897 [Pseudogymnoascus sp. VKM F-4281 (FW-2241)]|nr:hypothetical protein V493_04897 [Pseudogymnoascus sp. VKM F-4281 (FW-2241)]
MHTTRPSGQDDPAALTGASLPSSDPEPSHFKKITIGGLEGVGKSSLITALLKQAVDTSSGGAPNEILPPSIMNIIELRRGTVGDHSTISFWEYSYIHGQIEPIIYDNASILLYCFSLDFMGNVDDHLKVLRWKLEELCSPDFPFEINIPIFMVGCKNDSQNPDTTVGRERAKRFAQSIDLDGYFECSAMTGEGVTELLEAVLSTVFSAEKCTPRRQLWPKKKAGEMNRYIML